MLPIKLTNADIRNSDAYKEYYAVATGATPPKTKAGVRKTKSSFDTTITPPPTATAGTRLFTYAKGDDGDDDEEGDDDDDAHDDDDDQENANKDDDEEGDDDDEQKEDEENEKDKLYRDVNFNLERGVQMADVHTTQEFKDSHVTLTPTSSQMDVQDPTSMAPLPVYVPTLTPLTIATTTTVQHAPPPPTTAPSTLLQDLPNFGSLFGFDHQLNTLEANFSEFMQTNQFARAVSSIPEIVQRYMDQRMNKAVKVAVQIQSDRLCDKAQAKNEEFLKNIDENMQKIIKEQVKEQVKVQVVRSLLNRSLTLI
nr:hypothetical protein [Tanacetum cinerariifolium]